MSVFLVTWNLNKELSQYQSARYAFLSRLSYFEHIFEAGLETVAFVSTPAGYTSHDIYNQLLPALDQNDRIFITPIVGNYRGYVGGATRVWLDRMT